jgi:uncharacterized protein (TIGR00369 family)
MKELINSKKCFVCGEENFSGLQMTFIELDDGTVQAKYTVKEVYQGWPGITHGGIVAAILDEVMAKLVVRNGTDNRYMVTAKLEIKYRKPVPIGEEIVVSARKIVDKGKIVKASALLRNINQEILAEAESTFIQVNETLLNKLTQSQDLW